MTIMFKVNTQIARIPSFFYAVNCFLFMTTIYGVLLILGGEELFVVMDNLHIKTSNFDYLKNIYMSLLPIYVYYYYTIKGELKLQHILIFIIVLFCIYIANYLNDRAQAIIRSIENRSIMEGFTLNIGYKFLALLPLIALYKRNPLLQYLFTMISLFFIVICMKRGAILIGVICFLLFLYTMLKYANRSNRFIVVLMSVVSIAVGIYFIQDMLSTNDYFIYRIAQTIEGNTSNRADLYSIYIEHFTSEHNFLKFIFGNGANATLKIGKNYAHNDWLELAINNGVIGLLLYVGFYGTLLKDYLIMRRRSKYYSNVLLMVFIVLFLSSLFSMSYDSIDKSIAITLGFLLANLYTGNNENNLLYG